MLPCAAFCVVWPCDGMGCGVLARCGPLRVRCPQPRIFRCYRTLGCYRTLWILSDTGLARAGGPVGFAPRPEPLGMATRGTRWG